MKFLTIFLAVSAWGQMDSSVLQFGSGPYWAGWSEPIRGGQKNSVCDWRQVPRVEAVRDILVMVRVEGGKVGKMRLSSTECKIETEGLPFHLLEGISAQASVNWLKARAIAEGEDNALAALALHDAAVSDPALEELTSVYQPEKVRSRASFWLGNVSGQRGYSALERMLANDPSEKVRKEVTFALSLSKVPGALAKLIDVAKNDRTPAVRGQALFWLAQKAGNKQAAEVVADGVNDPDRQVKESAVFALSRLPKEESVPRLIELAKTNRDPDVRKKAMFWLGQSKDPKAVDFIEQVLK